MADERTVILQIPCAKEVLPMLLAGLTVRHIRLEEKGDGTYDLIVIGANGPLSDPFADARAAIDEKQDAPADA